MITAVTCVMFWSVAASMERGPEAGNPNDMMPPIADEPQCEAPSLGSSAKLQCIRHGVKRLGQIVYLPQRDVMDRKQIVSFPTDGMPRPERSLGRRSPPKNGLYTSKSRAPEFEEVHKLVSEEDYKAYREGTVGSDWFPYFHDQERYNKEKHRGDVHCAHGLGMSFEWREANWEEQNLKIAELRASDPPRDDDFPTGFADGDELYRASFQRGKAPGYGSRPFTSFHPKRGSDTRTAEEAHTFANRWHTSVADDQARDDAREDAKWEAWSNDQYANLF